MPAIDRCQPQVVRALRKAGWIVGEKPIYVDDETPIYIDLEARRPDGETSDSPDHIYIEVKCFPSLGSAPELYNAAGQYVFYRTILAQNQLDIPLFLAVPLSTYQLAFTSSVKRTMEDNQIQLIIIDLESEEIAAWIR